MIRQLAKYKILFKTERVDISSHIYIEKSTETTMDIIVLRFKDLDGCKAIYDKETYDVKFMKHIPQVGIGVLQQYKYHLTKE